MSDNVCVKYGQPRKLIWASGARIFIGGQPLSMQSPHDRFRSLDSNISFPQLNKFFSKIKIGEFICST